MKNNIIRFSILMLFLPISNANSKNSCDHLEFELTQGSYTFASGASMDPKLGLTVSANSKKVLCSYFLTFGYGVSANASRRNLKNGSDQYPVQLYQDTSPALTRVLLDATDAVSADQVIPGVIDSTTKQEQVSSHAYRAMLHLPPGQSSHPAYVKSGMYSDQFVVSLYSGIVQGGERELISQRTLALNYFVPKMVDLSLLPSGQLFSLYSTTMSLNFGELETGAVRALDILLLYNAGYRLSLSSSNRGGLKHESFQNRIPYTVTVGGSRFSLSSGSTEVSSGTGVSPPGGTRVPMQVTIGSTASALAGCYSDEIMVTVVSTE